MSWTAYKKRLRVGAKLTVINVRRPWRSRQVEIISRSKRSFVVKDAQGEMAKIPFLPAAFVNMANKDVHKFDVQFLANEDGPRFLPNGEKSDKPILAGQPYMLLRIDEEAP